MFFPISNRISRKHVVFQDPLFFNLQKVTEGNKHTFIQARVARWLIVASVKIKLKVHATQRHNRERAKPARWRAISKVLLLFGLTSYLE